MSVLIRLGVSGRLSSRLAQPLCRRYGSAAAVELDYDYYYDDESERRQKMNAQEIEDSDKWETMGRGVQWVIMGDPIVRRHVYAERLAKLLDVPHISMGTLVRQELNPTSPLYKKIASAVNQGKLVPEEVIFGLLTKRLEEGYYRGENGFILDGIPRTRMQAEILDQIADIDLVLNLKCSEEPVMKKTLGNGIYSSKRDFPCVCSSGLDQSLKSQSAHLQSSSTNSDTILKKKLHVYAEQMKPVEDYYRRQKKLLDFHGADAAGDTWQGLLAALQLQHMNAVASVSSSSQKLTA